jgi:hypothetical protein
LIGAQVNEEMETGIKEGEEAEHAAKANEIGELEEFSQGRDAKSEDEEAERPITSGVLESFDWIRAEIAGERFPYEKAERNETKEKNRNFGPFIGEERGHAANQPQKYFLRSMPAYKLAT